MITEIFESICSKLLKANFKQHRLECYAFFAKRVTKKKYLLLRQKVYGRNKINCIINKFHTHGTFDKFA